MNFNRSAFRTGMRDGIPIALAYFAVSFSLGIMAKQIGLSVFQGFLISFLNNASAGEFAAFNVIAANAPYAEMAVVTLITNARYLLMSCALSQKFDPRTPFWHRLLVGFDITDEIFGITIARPGALNPYYTYGAMCISIPAWSGGTALGVLAGNLFPASVVSALSVALYGMFLAIIIPPAKESKVIGGLVAAGFALSFLCSRISPFSGLSGSMKTILLTVLLAGAAAFLFPIAETDKAEAAKPSAQEE